MVNLQEIKKQYQPFTTLDIKTDTYVKKGHYILVLTKHFWCAFNYDYMVSVMPFKHMFDENFECLTPITMSFTDFIEFFKN